MRQIRPQRKRIDFRQPKFLLPLTLFPLILITGYLFIDLFLMETGPIDVSYPNNDTNTLNCIKPAQPQLSASTDTTTNTKATPKDTVSTTKNEEKPTKNDWYFDLDWNVSLKFGKHPVDGATEETEKSEQNNRDDS